MNTPNDGVIPTGAAADEMQAKIEAALAADREEVVRDMFATAALGALLTQPGWSPWDAARNAYRYADAMMDARVK